MAKSEKGKTKGPGLEKAEMSQLKRMVEIDDNIDFIRKDIKEYVKQGRESIKSLIAEKKRVREELNQIPLFGTEK